MRGNIKEIFKHGSTTFYTSSLFFPPKLRRDVSILYAFVRTADDYVDCVPQNAEGFRSFRADYELAIAGSASRNLIVDSYVDLSKRWNFNPEWTTAFLDAMEQDLTKSRYDTLEEVLSYIYGSAEAVGLMMATLMRVPEEGLEGARLLGRAFQYVNFIRDVQEDLDLGRVYLPSEDAHKCGLLVISKEEALKKPAEFQEFIVTQLSRYHGWRSEAQQYFHFIPKKARIAVSTAASMYDYTAAVIQSNPMVIFQRKIKPSHHRIIANALVNTLRIILGGV